MQPLPTHFMEGRFTYDQVCRQGNVAIFRQTHREGGGTRYEVVRIRRQREHTWPNGTTTPEREAYPGASAWGRDGWTCYTLPEAAAVVQALQTRQEDV